MKDADLVSECIIAMQKAVNYEIPVHVKCRIGVDEFDSYEFFRNFIETIYKKTGNKIYIIHARKAFLKGLSPKENRNIPPLIYERAYQLKKEIPEIELQINGGFKDFSMIEDALGPDKGMQGVMLGRLSTENPWVFSDVDRRFYGKPNVGLSRKEILDIWGNYGDSASVVDQKVNWSTLNKPIINLFSGEKFSASFRRFLGDMKNKKKYESYKSYIEESIKELEERNGECLYVKPPVDEVGVGAGVGMEVCGQGEKISVQKSKEGSDLE